MSVVTLQEAAADLSGLVDRVTGGEEIVIARSGQPVVKLVRIEGEPRRPGRLKGQIHMADDFDAPLPDEIARAQAEQLILVTRDSAFDSYGVETLWTWPPSQGAAEKIPTQ